MNKLFTKIAGVTLGFAMAIGVGVAVAGKQDVKATKADTGSYTITFANNTTQVTGISSSTNASTVIANDGSRSYVTTKPFTVNSGNVYYGDTKTCIRIGKSGAASSLSIALSEAGQVYATSIVVNGNNTGGSKNTGATLSVNGSPTQTTSTDVDDYTFDINADITSITLAGSASIRIYSITVNYGGGEEKEIVDTELSGTVSIMNGDTAWNQSDLKFKVKYDGDTDFTDVTANTTFVVNGGELPTVTETTTTTVSVKATFNETEVTENLTAYLTFLPLYAIERAYAISLSSGSTSTNTITIDGIYMGESAFKTYVLMNGAYGIVLYPSTAQELTVGEYYTVTGYLKNYNGLYEIAKANSLEPTYAVLSDDDRIAQIAAPVTYVVDGTETANDAYLASRKTSLTGVVTGSAVKTGTSVTTAITVGTTAIAVRLTTPSAEVAEAFNTSKNNETPITIEGFSSFFNGFQVNFIKVVSGDDNYHAADFARDLLKLTKGTCNASYDGVTDNTETLNGIWTTLDSADYWLKVKANAEEDALVNGTPDSSIVVPTTDEQIDAMSDADAIGAALYRYDYCTAKYSLTNFIQRTLTLSFESRNANFNADSNEVATIVVIIAIASISAFGCLLILKKRKHQ